MFPKLDKLTLFRETVTDLQYRANRNMEDKVKILLETRIRRKRHLVYVYWYRVLFFGFWAR